MTQTSTHTSRTVGIIGLGYVGLPVARAFFDAGHDIIGVDTDPTKVDRLIRGENSLRHFGDRFVADMTDAGRFTPTSDHAALAHADAILICVPTPLAPGDQPDLSAVTSTAERLVPILRPGQLVVLESTTWPGTTRLVLQPILERSGLIAGDADTGFLLAFSPERENPGSPEHTMTRIPKVVGGINPASTEAARSLYAEVVRKVVTVSSPDAAEATKLLENIYRATNIALVNEMKLLLARMGVDIWEVLDAAATKPFGFQRFDPGPGLGGHCIPIDPFYLAWRAAQFGEEARFVRLAGEINRAMPDHVVRTTLGTLTEQGVNPADARVLVLGLAYKPDVADPRESPAFTIIERLQEHAAAVNYHDPFIPRTPTMRNHALDLTSVAFSDAQLAAHDAIVIVTHHSWYDWRRIWRASRLIVDTRGVMRPYVGREGGARVVNA